MKRTLIAILGLGLAFAAGVHAGGETTDTVKARIAKALGITVDAVTSSPAASLYEVRKDHEFGYVTTDGKYLVQGDMVALDSGEQVTEVHRRTERLAALKDLGIDNMIEFAPPPPMATKYVVTVFTDIDCPYCRKLHSEIAQYNARGIAIRYLFFPRSGLNTPSYFTAEAVWCSSDRQTALTKAKRGENIPVRKCDNPVAREYQLGLDLGVHGTPMLILPNGQELPGYVPAQQLGDALDKIGPAVQLPPTASKG